MKKTLIALAVAASAAVSGSAMAWTASGTGGTIDLGGTLTPVAKVTPWEVQVGAAVTDLDANIQKGQNVVDVIVNKAIPVLGIRIADGTNKVFTGKAGLAPQVDFNGALDLDGFHSGVSTVTLNVNDPQSSQKIGTLTMPLSVGAAMSWKEGNNGARNELYAASAGKGFFGGLPKSAGGVASSSVAFINAISKDFTVNYTEQGVTSSKGIVETDFADNLSYSSFYGAGIAQGAAINIRLTAPAGVNTVGWKASMPITVSYQ